MSDKLISIPTDFISGALVACERVFHEPHTGSNVISGTFNRVQHELPAEIESVDQLPSLPHRAGWLYGKFVMGEPKAVKWNINIGVISFGTLIVNSSLQLAGGSADTTKDWTNTVELAIPTIGNGFLLTEERKQAVRDLAEFSVKVRYDLYVEDRFVTVQHVDFVYLRNKPPHRNERLSANTNLVDGNAGTQR